MRPAATSLATLLKHCILVLLPTLLATAAQSLPCRATARLSAPSSSLLHESWTRLPPGSCMRPAATSLKTLSWHCCLVLLRTLRAIAAQSLPCLLTATRSRRSSVAFERPHTASLRASSSSTARWKDEAPGAKARYFYGWGRAKQHQRRGGGGGRLRSGTCGEHCARDLLPGSNETATQLSLCRSTARLSATGSPCARVVDPLASRLLHAPCRDLLVDLVIALLSGLAADIARDSGPVPAVQGHGSLKRGQLDLAP